MSDTFERTAGTNRRIDEAVSRSSAIEIIVDDRLPRAFQDESVAAVRADRLLHIRDGRTDQHRPPLQRSKRILLTITDRGRDTIRLAMR